MKRRFALGMAIKLTTFLGIGVVLLSATKIEEFAYALTRLGMPYKLGFAMTLAFRLVPVFLDAAVVSSRLADAVLLMRQSREVGLKPQAFLGGGAGFDSAQFEGEKDISNLVFSVTQWTPDMKAEGAEEFAARYQQKYGKKPTYHAACAYAAMMVVGEAAAKAGGDRAKSRQALDSGTWDGIMGEVKFEDYEGFTNQNKHVMPVIQYQGGKAVTVFPPKFAKTKAVYPFPGWK